MSRIAHSRRRADWTHPPIQYAPPGAVGGFEAWLPESSRNRAERLSVNTPTDLGDALRADHQNKTGVWEVYADSLQASGNELGDALAVELHANGRLRVDNLFEIDRPMIDARQGMSPQAEAAIGTAVVRVPKEES